MPGSSSNSQKAKGAGAGYGVGGLVGQVRQVVGDQVGWSLGFYSERNEKAFAGF